MKISEMCLVILHPENENYILEEVKDMSKVIDIIDHKFNVYVQLLSKNFIK